MEEVAAAGIFLSWPWEGGGGGGGGGREHGGRGGGAGGTKVSGVASKPSSGVEEFRSFTLTTRYSVGAAVWGDGMVVEAGNSGCTGSGGTEASTVHDAGASVGGDLGTS